MDQVYPNEGLVNNLTSLVFGLGNGVGTLNVDVYTAPTTPPGVGSQFGLMTLGVLNGLFTALSSAVGGTNSYRSSDFALHSLVGNIGSIQGPTCQFTNVSGVSQSVYGYVLFDAVNELLVALAQYDGAPIVVPNGGTINVIPILGQYSALTS